MGVYLLNISVDTADQHPDAIAEDLSFNDQESLVEIMVEQVLGFEDAFKEYDDLDPEDHSNKGQKTIDLVVHVNSTMAYHLMAFNLAQAFPRFNDLLTLGFYQIDTPPPKA